MNLSQNRNLTYRQIFFFWSPLALTWAMMAFEGPMLNAVVSRLPMQRENLAAYGLAAAIAMIIESPIMMILSATVALVKDAQSFEALRQYSQRMNIMVTIAMLIVIIPPVHEFIALTVLSLTPEISSLLHRGLMCLVLWPMAIGYRRFYQGLMIKRGRTRLVAIGTIARLLTMSVTSLSLLMLSDLPGVLVGTISLGSGVALEAIATRWMARDVIREIRLVAPVSTSALSNSSINKFYIPLALTSVMAMAVNPMLAFFMSRFSFMVESLAVFPVVDSFVFLFRSPGVSYQEVGIALLGENNINARKIRNFGFMMMLITTSLLAAIAFSPLLSFIYTVFPYRLEPGLFQFAVLPTQLLVALPAFSVLYSLQRAVLMNKHRTRQVTLSTLIEISCIALVLFLEWMLGGFVGVVAVSIALIVGRVGANLYLNTVYRRTLRGE